jgi:hypothetical protein
MHEMVIRNESASAICEWLSTGFDNNWSSSQQHPYVMLNISLDHADSLPDEVMVWATREQRSPTSPPHYALPAGILAKHYLGYDIPKPDHGELPSA